MTCHSLFSLRQVRKSCKSWKKFGDCCSLNVVQHLEVVTGPIFEDIFVFSSPSPQKLAGDLELGTTDLKDHADGRLSCQTDFDSQAACLCVQLYRSEKNQH